MRSPKKQKKTQFDKIYKELLKNIEELCSGKITPKEANKRAKEVRERIKKL